MEVKPKHIASPKMRFNRFTLSFTGSHSHLEAAFHDHYFRNTIKQIRIAVFAALIFYASFGVLDALIMPDRYQSFWIVRWAIVCPCILILLLSSYTRFAYRHLQMFVSIVTFICGLGIIAMVQLAAPKLNHAYVGGLVQIIFFIFTFARLRFVWGSGVAVILVAIYLITTISVGIAPGNYVIGKGFHLSLICVLGMMAGYAIEYQTRKNFFLSRQLKSKKRRLALANDFLEERVAKRTSELNQINAILKDEISERKVIESALRDSQKRFRRMVNNVTDHMCVYDLEGNILEANRQMISGLGYTFDELTAKKYQDLIVPSERADYYQYLTDIRRKGTAVGTITLETQNGRSRFFEYSNVLSEHTPRHKAIFSLARDVTDRKKTEQALADSQMRFQNIFETAAAGMAIIDGPSKTVVEINRACAQMVGRNISKIQGVHVNHLIVMPDDAELDVLPVPAPHPIECFLKTADGNDLPILANTQKTVFNEQSNWIISFVNIQKIKEAEATQRELEIRSNRAQHLESIGTLAGGIAHDFNNILFGIMGFAELALDDADHRSIQANNLKEIIRGGNRAKEMIAQILTFSRQESVQKIILQPAPLIKEALKLLRASLPSSIELRNRFGSDLSDIEGNPTHLHQVIMNLCTNAAHALGENNGHIDISVDNKTLIADKQSSHGLVPKGDYVQLMVKDNGDGIQPEILGRIFEPFYTTKSQGQGSGMGLSVVLGIVQAHNGSIQVNSRLGEGTCIEVLFPAVKHEDLNMVPTENPLPRGTEKVLVVDDERPLLVLLDRMLSSLGYQVTTCREPTEALTLFTSQTNYFDLVVSDLTMPKISGKKLAEELLQLQPDLPILLITGYGDKISKEQIHELGVRDLLIKPILKKDLASGIRRALDAN